MNILIFASFITDDCLKRRANHEYLTFSGRKKVLMLSRALESLGHSVDICSTSYAKTVDWPFTEGISEKIRVIHAPTFGLFGKTSFFKRTVGTLFGMSWLTRHHRRYQMVIFYNYHAEFCLPALFGKRVFGLKAVMDYEDGLFNDKGYQTGFYRCLEKRAYRESSGFILVNRGLRERVEKFARDKKPAVIINGYLDTALLQKNRDRRGGSGRKVAFTGNFNRDFGFEELLEYVDHMPGDFSLVITGRASPEEEALLRQHVERRPNVRFMGYLNSGEFEALLRDVDIFILLNNPASHSSRTNFPSKLFDYLSRNRFVLSTPNPALEAYYTLKNFLLLRNFPDDLARLDRILLDRAPDARELFLLNRDIISSLDQFFREVSL